MQYVYKCKVCGRVREDSYPMGEAPARVWCDGTHDQDIAITQEASMVRYYAAEVKRLNGMQQMKMERDPGYDPTLFLPTKKDFAGPGDPDGEKGMNKWMEDHRPADTSNGAKMVDPRKL